MDVISEETNCIHHIHNIVNCKIYSDVTNKSVDCVMKRNVRQADEISVNNSPSTLNVRMQTSIKHSSKVLILSDSHLKGCTEKINNQLGDMFRITGWIKPGGLAEEILDKPTMNLRNLNKRDVTVISAGANDVYMNNSNMALLKITKLIQNNCNTNIIIFGVPHRYDLLEYSCVNTAIQVFNSKLKKVATSFNCVTILECNYNREYFTNHGMHLNGRGKRLVSKQLASEISKLTVIEAIAPISLGWKVEQEHMVSSNVVNNETDIVGIDNPIKELKDEADKQVIEDQHDKETSGISANSLNTETVTNNNNAEIPTKSKRLRKAPIARSNDFFMVTPRSVSLGNESNLKIFAQNIRCLGNKIDELAINWIQDPPYILCLSEHHLSTEVIPSIIVDNYKQKELPNRFKY